MISKKPKDDPIISEYFSGQGWGRVYYASGKVAMYCSAEPPGPSLTKERTKAIRKKMAENKKKLATRLKMRNTFAGSGHLEKRT